MSHGLLLTHGLLTSFLVVFSALFSIVNPPGSAIIFSQITAGRPHSERLLLARQIGFYAAIIMLVALWGGAYVLSFFGISIAALRLAGGAVVAASAWRLLFMADRYEEAKQKQAAIASDSSSIAFFPLTMPLTAGPGTIAVAVAIGSNMPADASHRLSLIVGGTAAAIAVAICVWLAYASADRILSKLGPGGARVLSRLSAFLLLCIGTQIALTGIADFYHHIVDGRAPI